MWSCCAHSGRLLNHVANQWQFSNFSNRKKKQVIQAGSVYGKLLPKIFVWKDGLDYDKQEANRFVQHILKFLSVASKKYSKEEFAVMPLPIFFACYNCAVAGNNNLFAVQGGDRQQASHRVHQVVFQLDELQTVSSPHHIPSIARMHALTQTPTRRQYKALNEARLRRHGPAAPLQGFEQT